MKAIQLLKKIINENLLDNCTRLETYNCFNYEAVEFGSTSDISSFETVVFLIYVFTFQQRFLVGNHPAAMAVLVTFTSSVYPFNLLVTLLYFAPMNSCSLARNL